MRESTLEGVKNLGDVGAVSTAGISIFTSLLPELAAGASLLWMLIRIGEWAYNKIKSGKAKK